MIKVILKRGREESLRRFHPWVFSGAIAEVQGNPLEGDVVAVHASDGEFLAYGHYQIGSIAVRVLSFDESALRADFWEDMLSRALGFTLLRAKILLRWMFPLTAIVLFTVKEITFLV